MRIVKICRDLLQSATQIAGVELVIERIVKIFDALFYIQVKNQLDDQILENLCGMLSLQWIFSHSNETAFNSDLLALSQQLSNNFSPETQSHCLFLLSLIPRHVHLDWRNSVYHWALQSPHEIIQASCVTGFPILLHQSGVKFCNMIPMSLLDLINDESESIKKAYASIVGKLACCLSGTFNLRPDLIEPDISHINCDIFCRSLTVNSDHENTHLVKVSVFMPFFNLLESKVHSSVKLAFIENIPHLFKHLDFSRENESDIKTLVGALLKLMEDPDKDVRVAFSNHVRYVLESLNSEEGFIKELFVSRMKDAYTNAKISRNNELKDTLILTTGDIGRAAKGDLVPFSLLHLLHCLLSKSASVAGAAYTEIRALAAAKSIKLQAFFSQYKKP
uniref:Uncharacterized protein n=1 Tax=Sphenodon punctatus TaxID=8508 RepID=A0A8D0H0F7_SPHPU